MKNFIALTLFPFSVCIACDDVTAITETKMECYSRIVDTYWQCVDEGKEILCRRRLNPDSVWCIAWSTRYCCVCRTNCVT